jgi:hypothetical protein
MPIACDNGRKRTKRVVLLDLKTGAVQVICAPGVGSREREVVSRQFSCLSAVGCLARRCVMELLAIITRHTGGQTHSRLPTHSCVTGRRGNRAMLLIQWFSGNSAPAAINKQFLADITPLRGN